MLVEAKVTMQLPADADGRAQRVVPGAVFSVNLDGDSPEVAHMQALLDRGFLVALVPEPLPETHKPRRRRRADVEVRVEEFGVKPIAPASDDEQEQEVAPHAQGDDEVA